MKKRLSIFLLLVTLVVPPITAKATEGSWHFEGSGTKVFGGLYFYNGTKDEANASSTNRSSNNVKVLVKLYASDNGQTISKSWREARDYPKASARQPEWWGSIHSTTPTNDPYENLSLYAR